MPSHSTKYEKNMNKDTPDHYLKSLCMILFLTYSLNPFIIYCK